MNNKKKGGLSKRYQTSYNDKDSSGGKKGIFNWGNNEVSFFSTKEIGKYRINIIPYKIKTKNHPLVKRGEFEIGDMDYTLDFWAHRNVGPSESTVLCLKQTYGKPCPICEQLALLNKQGEGDKAKELKPTRRVIYNVEDLKNPGELKVFETSHALFEKELIDEARDDEGGGFVDFADPEEGKEVSFKVFEKSAGKFKFNAFKSFNFESRDEEISDDLLESAVSFDECLVVPTYEEVEKIFYGNDDDEDSDDESKKSKKHSDEDDEEETPKSKNKHRDEEPEEDSDDESKKSKKHSDEDDEEEDSGSKCPYGHRFGKDCDVYPDDCDNCKCWDKCCKA